MNTWFGKVKDFALELVFPFACLGCGAPAESIAWCARCKEGLPSFPYLTCAGCRRRVPDGRTCEDCRPSVRLAGLIAPLPYGSRPVREAILALKYHGVGQYAKALAEVSAAYLVSQTPPLPVFTQTQTLVVPVPLWRERFKERGFNQAELIAARITEAIEIPLVSLLIRVRDTKPQTEIESKKERRENVAHAFALARPVSLKGKTILLVDDVYTTGATMAECARVLRRAGAKEVWGVAIARG